MAPTRFPPHLKPIEPQGSYLLEQERKKASFDPSTLKIDLYGEEYLARRDRILQILENDPVLGDKSHRYFTGRDIRFKKALEAAKRLVDLTKIHNWTPEEYAIADFLFDESGPFRLHRSMFMPTIENQGTEEQKKKYLEPAKRFEIIGCYAQTELGHGSNVRGLETTATYDPCSQTFVIHSPTLTASKWWIGGLGVAANHAVVMARLISNGKDFGPHPFVVQIRDLKTHEPLPGVTVGDIGPKFGFNTVDNGFILFDHVRVPHDAMMARYSKIDKATGNYIKPPNEKLAYGTMVFVRANIVLESRLVLARAATVAIRYSAVRAQFIDDANPKKVKNVVVETPVLDYRMQQYRLFPVIAQAYACHFTALEMHRMYYENQAKMANGDFSYLADLHASSSGLKSLVTTMGVAGIEECRRACGGHGYSLFSGLGQFYQDYLPKVTWEGDNYLLTQQTTRYLMKTLRAVRAGGKDTHFSSAYLREYLSSPQRQCPVQHPDELANPEILLSAFRFRAAFLIDKAVEAMDVNQRSWNDMLVEIYRISRAHCQLLMATHFVTAVYAADYKYPVLQKLALLFCLSMLEQEMADFLTSGYLTPPQALLVKEYLIRVLNEIRPEVVALVDAFDFPEYLLQSALGAKDGDAYVRMTRMAELEPLNQNSVAASYNDCIKPLIHAGQTAWKFDRNGNARL
ncbi:acyl-CoA dehydrogenase/oxidase [Dichotomocladium elegans]|nr:acyl-CoA dehydrogenase/oxidase [Dichotomocladium elegans]